MEPPVVILVGTSHPGNVGAAARGGANFGVTEMRFVAPRCDIHAKEALDRAVHAKPLLEQAKVYSTLKDALEGTSLSVGTTARMSEARHTFTRKPMDARDWSESLRESGWLGRMALVFGPEDFGLSNEDVNLCDQLVTVPTSDYASLNLAHAVTILAYEHFLLRSRTRIRHERSLEPDALHALNRAWDAVTEEVEDRQWRRNVAQGVWRKVLGRSNPDTYEVHNIFGIVANVLKRFDHPEYATAMSTKVLTDRGLLVKRTFGAGADGDGDDPDARHDSAHHDAHDDAHHDAPGSPDAPEPADRSQAADRQGRARTND